ncbi:MAG: energy-coupling factor transporter ATPase [Oscillospiraceae bacterium]|nr:energy-coupling factor transporter ATPase [Oscillospiraceae bacterium]MDY3791138.1 energy-coupling factor transporter ATPase [Oscillospiraceae bacterium]MDY6207265.1 energy-coupling factor transporter ATPase [Oscillospiraceae bacterium]
MENIISAEDLMFYYSEPSEEEQDNGQEENKILVFEDLNLSIEKGSFTVILGHNGCGKSTFAKHTNAILLPCGGKMTAAGFDTSDESRLFDIRKHIGMVFQNPDNQIVASVVEEDVAFALENMGVPPDEMRVRVDEALKAVGMYEYREHAPSQLSGGQKQRVAIAGIIAMKPDCIVLDEPTAMLDPAGRREVMKTIKRLNRENGVTIVLITHYMDEAAQADRVVVMDGGKVILDDTPSEVFSHVEKLREVGLDVPQSTQLMYLLRENGRKDADTHIITEEECADFLERLLRGK